VLFLKPTMIAHLLRIVRESIKAVPAMKYALAVAGILAVVAMVGAFKLTPQTAVFGAVLVLVLMVAVVIFARLTTTASRHFFLPVLIMTWAFLIVTVATALLLFTSAFFQWPRGLGDLIDARPATPATQTATAEIQNYVAAARQQRTGRDYPGAWSTIGRAVTAAPESKAAREEQVRIAMAWVREMSVRAPETFTNAVRPLLECLHLNATAARGVLAADIHAHIGWANFLRFRETRENLRIEEEYAAAAALDETNPFAHAMWGHWLATRDAPLEEVNEHFRTALATNRERPYVQHMRINALSWLRTPEARLEMLRVADEMRRNQEDMRAGDRRTIYNSAYVYTLHDDDAALLAVLPARDHLATFRWLLEGADSADKRDTPVTFYYLARLTEAAGDFAVAADAYSRVLKHDTTFDELAKAGLARCEARIMTSNGGDLR
jgi:hypothetical protein